MKLLLEPFGAQRVCGVWGWAEFGAGREQNRAGILHHIVQSRGVCYARGDGQLFSPFVVAKENPGSLSGSWVTWWAVQDSNL